MGTPGSRAVVEGLSAFVDAVNGSKIFSHLDAAYEHMRSGQTNAANAAIEKSEESLISAMHAKESLNDDARRAFLSAAGESIGDAAARAFIESIAKSATDRSKAASAIRAIRDDLDATVRRANHALDIITPLVAPMPTPEERDTLTIKFAGKASMDSLSAMSSYSKDFAFLVSVMGRVSGGGAEPAKIISVEEGCLEVTIAATAGTILTLLSGYNLILDARAKNMDRIRVLISLSRDDEFPEHLREAAREEANRLLEKQFKSIPQRLLELGKFDHSESKSELESLLSNGLRKLNQFVEDGGSFSRGSFSSEESERLLKESVELLPQARDAKIAGLLKPDASAPSDSDEEAPGG